MENKNKRVCFVLSSIYIIFACKNKKNDRNFLSWHVNNCYIFDIALYKGDIIEER